MLAIFASTCGLSLCYRKRVRDENSLSIRYCYYLLIVVGIVSDVLVVLQCVCKEMLT